MTTPDTNLSSQPLSSSLNTTENSLNRRDFLKLGAAFSGAALLSSSIGNTLSALASEPTGEKKPVNPHITTAPAGNITAHPFEERFKSIEGLSTNQLQQHVGLYQGYVKKTNEIQQLLETAEPDFSKANGTYDPFRELHLEQSFALNGVLLHELYFGNLGGPRTGPSDTLKDHFKIAFGSWERFTSQLKALGKCARGWVMAGVSIRDGQIHLFGMDAHNQGVPFGVIPLLMLDVYEHAYLLDFGTNRGSYLDVFMANIDWTVVEARLHKALAVMKIAHPTEKAAEKSS